MITSVDSYQIIADFRNPFKALGKEALVYNSLQSLFYVLYLHD